MQKKLYYIFKNTLFFFFRYPDWYMTQAYFYTSHTSPQMLKSAWGVDQERERLIVYVSEECDCVQGGSALSHVILPCVCLCVFVSVCARYTVEEGLTDCLPIEVWPLLSAEHYKAQRCSLQSGWILTRPRPAALAVSLLPKVWMWTWRFHSRVNVMWRFGGPFELPRRRSC